MAVADPGVYPDSVPPQECPEMAELETKDPMLEGGLTGLTQPGCKHI